jgi:hypothetical protein
VLAGLELELELGDAVAQGGDLGSLVLELLLELLYEQQKSVLVLVGAGHCSGI